MLVLWLRRYRILALLLVLGFDDYALEQRKINLIDLVFWAIACGALDLAGEI